MIASAAMSSLPTRDWRQFRLLLPLENLECNYIIGSEQRLASFERTETGLTLHWKGPFRNEAGRFDLDVTLWIELVDDSVQFRCRVVNRTRISCFRSLVAQCCGMTGTAERSGTAGQPRQ